MHRSKHPKWLSEYKWDWFAKLKLDFGPSTRRQALLSFDNWLEVLEAREGGRHFRWVRVINHDGNWDNICLYVLVGGLRNRRDYYQRRWKELNGRGLIERFDPSLPAIKSMLKAIDRNEDLEIICEFPDKSRQKRTEIRRLARNTGAGLRNVLPLSSKRRDKIPRGEQ